VRSHLDQPGRYTGTIRIQDEIFPVDAFGMRDRSWGVRSQFGTRLHPGAPFSHGGYSYATASPRDAFHTVTAEIGGQLVSIHGFLLRDGEWSKLVEGRREVLERKDGCPTRVRITGRDALGRALDAEGRCQNRIGLHLNPNLWTWNCLTEWSWDGGLRGTTAEDHDNWSAAAFRRLRARGVLAGRAVTSDSQTAIRESVTFSASCRASPPRSARFFCDRALVRSRGKTCARAPPRAR
jgi:hypothetical protein